MMSANDVNARPTKDDAIVLILFFNNANAAATANFFGPN